MVNTGTGELVINIYKVFFLLLQEFILEDLKTFNPAVESASASAYQYF